MKLPQRRQFLYLAAGLGGAVLGGAAAWLAAPRAERRALQLQVLRLQAEVAAAKIDQFVGGIERQIGWITQLPWPAQAIDKWRAAGERLLREVPAITELSQLDAAGKRQARVSRLAIVTEPERPDDDHSQDPIFTVAVERGVYYGPVYFRREAAPYMTLSLAGARRDAGVIVAEVNLGSLWDLVDAIKVGHDGQAFVIDARNRLIAHPDLSLVLRNTDMSKLTQVIAARSPATGSPNEPVQTATDLRGRAVLTAYAPVARLGWLVFVELPTKET
jgi:hypothetical protein